MSKLIAARARSWAGGLALAGLLSACGGGDEGAGPASERRSPAAAVPAAVAGNPVTVEQLLDWAEISWPLLFPTGPATIALSHEGRDYTLRHYPVTGNYIGVATDGSVWGLGGFTGWVLQGFEHISDYTCLVDPGRCLPDPQTCQTAVSSGFSGDLNATYDFGGDGGADGDSGSAGVGGSEGKVLDARLRVIRLSDGAVLAEGMTDGQRGLATLKWCRDDLPLLLELSGAPGARYYDEGVGALVGFPTQRKLRALVDRFDENVGISALTEAAYRYAQNNLVVDVVAVHGDRSPLAAPRRTAAALADDTVPVGLSADRVRKANAAVLSEVNRQLTGRLQQVSMKSLATPIDDTSGVNALPTNRYGRMAAFSGGTVLMARSYAPSLPTPALTLADELALDLTDGRINGFALDGSAVATATRRTYDSAQLSENWALGEGLLSRRFGRDTTGTTGESVLNRLDFRHMRPDGRVHVAARYRLDKFGVLTGLARQIEVEPGTEIDPRFFDLDNSDFTLPPLSVVSQYRFNGIPIDARGFSDASALPSMFAVATDGRLYGWGDDRCGAFSGRLDGNAFRAQPVQVMGLPPVLRVVGVDGAFFALARDGSVYAWGLNRNHVLDPLGPVSDGSCQVVGADGEPRSWPVVLRPRKLAGVAGVRYLSGGAEQGMALGQDGLTTVFGLSAVDRAPVEAGEAVYDRYAQFGGAAAGVVRTEAVTDAAVALLRDGSVELQTLRVATFRRQPVAGLSDVVDLLTLPAAIVSLDPQGRLTLSQAPCGSLAACSPVHRSASSCTVRDAQDRSVTLPRAVRLSRFDGSVGFIGADGRLYQLQTLASSGACSWRQRELQG